MSNVNKIVLSLRPVAAVTALMALNVLGAGTAWAGEDDSPLSLTFSENLTRDSNFSKDDSRKAGETISTTAAQFLLNKTYGRQNYEVDGTLSALRYKNFDQLNNDGRNINGGFTSGFLRDWTFRANGTYDEALNAIQNNATDDRLVRNIRKFRDTGTSIQYGRDGSLWAVAATYDHNKQNYSLDAQKYQDASQSTKGLKAMYFASDILQYSLGVRRVVTSYPNNPNYWKTVDRNLDLSTILQITGLSNLSATITKRRTEYTFVTDDTQSTGGWTGSLNWAYSPHGILRYSLGFTRTTGTDRSQTTRNQTVNPGDSSYGYGNDIVTSKINSDTTTTSLDAGVRADLTGKISANVSYSVSQYKVSRAYDVNFKHSLDLSQGVEAAANSYNHSMGIGVNYAATRSLGFRCGYQRYSQTADYIAHLKYTGNAVDCSANFTLNPY
ncbi:MAG: hypothetical protein QM749_11735 [Aquabacterium sp.]